MAFNETLFIGAKASSLEIVITMTILYGLIFLTGIIGNLSTCVVIARNRHMRTTTNYYLFSLAVSDLLLLISGLPQEIYFSLWENPYSFGKAVCILTGLAAETCANATVLTIAAFTIERYIAVCHPFFSHTICKLSRAVKLILVTWTLAVVFAVPQAIQFEVLTINISQVNGSNLWTKMECTIQPKRTEWQNFSFELSTGLFFVCPLILITFLYILIALKLRNSKRIKRPPMSLEAFRNQTHVNRMLVAVVVAFFICWAPFHAQRLLAIHASKNQTNSQTVANIYTSLTYVSGILYFVSTTVNPVLYNIMSLKFREAFKSTIYQLLGRGRKSSAQSRTYSVLSRVQPQNLANGATGTDSEPKISVSLRVKPPPQVRPSGVPPNWSLREIETELTETELAQYLEQINAS